MPVIVWICTNSNSHILFYHCNHMIRGINSRNGLLIKKLQIFPNQDIFVFDKII